MKIPINAMSLRRIADLLAALPLILCVSCAGKETIRDDVFENPVILKYENTSVYFHEGLYYYITNDAGRLNLFVNADPTQLERTEPCTACQAKEQYGLLHIWHPQIVNIRGKWYVYLSADDGNTDNHQIYVLENPEKDPRKGTFTMRGRIKTDPDDNWAIHAHVFEYDGELYMIWSGWESRRVYAETQGIYIAKLENPWTQCTPRVRISVPEHEWERQWVNPNGYKTAYPVYVNEAPFFFGNDRTDRLYIYYSASAMWTPYYAIGELSAAKGSDLLNAASWKKEEQTRLLDERSRMEGRKIRRTRSYSGGICPGTSLTSSLARRNRIFPDLHGPGHRGRPLPPLFAHRADAENRIFGGGNPELGSPEPVGKALKKTVRSKDRISKTQHNER